MRRTRRGWQGFACHLINVSEKMKISIHALLFTLFSILVSAAEPKIDYGFTIEPEKIQSGGYVLGLKSVELHQGELSKGIFYFRWEGNEPIDLWGLGFDEDGAFRVLFENTATFDGEQWTATNFGHCGTGMKLYPFELGKEYSLRIPIWQFNGEDGETGVVKVGGDKISVVSKPFSLADLARAIANKAALDNP